MAQMTFSVGQAKTMSTKLKSEAKKVDGIKSNLDKDIKDVNSYWKGDSQDAFNAQYTKFAPSLVELSKLVTDIGTQLGKIADIKEQTEKKIAASFK
ncbi:WXG100 family type VII secretion target [Cellulosilyticum lentocellum]|uniref:ESAT-6-like protein n=1 Tax=Cellulosilyticum lentocellum (strain ATCC 49066 / DSM 5427 / NCIMB 11756 / RHM5) TaxID=642492 RepID=F2JHS8_CELLD|nr:WXG100 family type VII secretion target [Cellulosilyticum lentocellum]ADZ85420.1 hypothetical protein Clole_3739 [Cellulosilyticum lentocellum DSM 5427]ADZ85437.1 hypothetical protein Clole_3757 [Cellulosilyticum lentocellum DSM 5427]